MLTAPHLLFPSLTQTSDDGTAPTLRKESDGRGGNASLLATRLRNCEPTRCGRRSSCPGCPETQACHLAPVQACRKSCPRSRTVPSDKRQLPLRRRELRDLRRYV